MAVIDIDKGYRAMVRRIRRAIRGDHVTVGIHAEEGGEDHDGPTLVEVAEAHEFGTETIPARSFVRGFVDENEPEINALMRRAEEQVLRGTQTPGDALGQMGSALAGGMQKRIANGIPPALDEETIKRKGSSTPLIDKGQLRAGITHRVEVAS